MGYTYKLYKQKNIEEKKQGRYKESHLTKMTTFQLREICKNEKLIKNALNDLKKDDLIRLIMRYRGIKESLLIKNHSDDGLDRLEKFIKNSQKIILHDKTINIPSKIKVYEGIGVEIFDNYIVESKDKIQEGNIILVDQEFNISTIFNLIRSNKSYYMIKDKSIKMSESYNKHYSLLYFDKEYSELIYDIYNQNKTPLDKYIKCYQINILDFAIEQLGNTGNHLAIDFGTSNTTAGIYINDNIEIAKVVDTTSLGFEQTPIIPSVVGVKIINENQVEYKFGYDAINLSRSSYIDEGICIFYDIKRWISDYEREEKISDINGQRKYIKRKDIIKAYLEHIIDISRQRFKSNFKKIHISCPTKQKHKFYRLFKEILSDYDIEYQNMLDEGGAVLFNTISQMIQKKQYSDGKIHKALIIDCGGGTTDLSSCEFVIQNNRVSYNIDMKTSYENGDTDFGGNNLTFRIMQLIKILFVKKIKKESINQNLIFENFDIDLFRAVDEDGIMSIYSKFSREYDDAESLIPTRFKEYENKSSEDYFKVKSNYYTLFELAEEIKKEFFCNKINTQISVSSNKDCKESKYISFDKWKIHMRKNEIFERIEDMDSIELNIYEIETLIKAEIYLIIKKFLDPIDKLQKLEQYNIIKLTGQSCKIDIFKEAIKEFIPGRKIASRKSIKNKNDSYDLKLICLKGALEYLRFKSLGYMNLRIDTEIPTLPYIISAYNHVGSEKILIRSLDQNNTSGNISRFMDRIDLKLYLKDINENIRYEYVYQNKPEDFVKITFKEIEEKYPQIIAQDQTDNIVNDEVKFFVWAQKQEWGFCVLPVLRQNENLFIGREEFFNFENDIWETNFFDGFK